MGVLDITHILKMVEHKGKMCMRCVVCFEFCEWSYIYRRYTARGRRKGNLKVSVLA